MAIHTPLRPYIGASSAARVSRTPQMLRKFMVHGMIVSAAPTKTPYATMEAANIGSANASMRRAMAPRSLTSATGVIMPMICGARMYINIPVVPITSIPIIMVILPKLLASSFCLAPTLCPTRVVAASAIPYPGI